MDGPWMVQMATKGSERTTSHERDVQGLVREALVLRDHETGERPGLVARVKAATHHHKAQPH
jgi:hypothetical protein